MDDVPTVATPRWWHFSRTCYQDIREGQVDTDLRGSGGLDEINKGAGKRASEAPRKDDPFDKTH
jgi:hypothetical protein